MLRPSVPYPSGHLFRLSIAVLLITANCILMRITASMVVLCVRDTDRSCRADPGACRVSALSVLGSVLPASAAALSGAFGIAAAKRPALCAFIGTIACGCPLMTLAMVLALLFNGLRHGYHIVPVLVPDVIELAMFGAINILTVVMSAICARTLANASKAASTVAVVTSLAMTRTETAGSASTMTLAKDC